MDLVLCEQETSTCTPCAKESVLEEMHGGLCEECHFLSVRTCNKCGSEYNAPFVNSCEVDPYPLCSDCTIICQECSERTEETVTVRELNLNRGEYNDREVCESCRDNSYTRCDDCLDFVNSDSTTRVATGSEVCYSCRESYSYCEGCSEYYHGDYMRYSESNECEYCESCYPEEEDSADVNSYDYSPQAMFFDAKGNRTYTPAGLFHGYEIEAGWKNGDKEDYAEQVTSALGDICYLKSDSTITSGTGLSDGFEIVTHPCSLEWHRESLKKICDGKIPGLLSHNTANAGCGMHISVNRDGLTNLAIARICAFIGADRNESWIVKLARRNSTQWAEIAKKTCIEDTLERLSDGSERLKVNDNRYEAVNLHNSSHVEFRLFRGTLKYSSAMLCLEFVNALCRWCLEPTDPALYQSGHALLEFAKNEPEVYPHLVEFLCTNLP